MCYTNCEVSGTSLAELPKGVQHRLVFQSPRPEYVEDTEAREEQFYIPARGMALVRPKLDVVVLPGGSSPAAASLRKMWAEWCASTGTLPEQAVWTDRAEFPAFFRMETAFDGATAERVQQAFESLGVHSTSPVQVLPYSCTPATEEMVETHLRPLFPGITVQRTSTGMPEAHKGVLAGISALKDRGYVPEQVPCRTLGEVLKALSGFSEKVSKFVFKPVYGTSGDGIQYFSTQGELEEIVREAGESLNLPVVIEEFLNIDTSPFIEAAPATYCMHFWNDRAVLDLTHQLLIGDTYCGFMTDSRIPAELQNQAAEIAKAVYDSVRPVGPWGIDIVTVNGHPKVIDLNVGRFNGSHFGKMLAEAEGRAGVFGCFTMPAGMALEEVKRMCGGNRLNMRPLVYLEGLYAIMDARGSCEVEVLKSIVAARQHAANLAMP